MRRGLVLGAGGPLGYAFSLCALRRFEENTGWDARSADTLVGTSAGSVIAAMLGAGTPTAELLAEERRSLAVWQRSDTAREHLPPLPRGAPMSLRLFGQGLLGRQPALTAVTGLLPAGRQPPLRETEPLAAAVPPGAWVAHPRCWIVAMDLETGARVAFGRPGAPPASIHEAVAASSAVPGWVAPVTIDGRRYIDGGAVSATSADLLAGEGLDEVVVISPMTSARFVPPVTVGQAAERLLRALLSRRLAGEIARLQAGGTRVLRIEATARDLGLMGANFMDRRRAPQLISAWYP